ncbi:hypothetical protein VCRA2121O391_320062 [Vibrio crassostreae]|nr:hypothetical protein VCRA2117O378_340005 [Vibrio crassostreae]CAK2040791.1 hypothetical protein VCRA2113O356_330062 [Vibrio crassostreae]CAK2345427.1 hypothetical protein VCRA2119O386_320005 [Vibrio crassostreae]CAK2810015.1 hypothetical protein VCRA2117O375_310063 [Vibrio crassostreae]CAK2882621.1 hypothetical protein VCRA2121O391_320062 [Vibrio crassostreae]
MIKLSLQNIQSSQRNTDAMSAHLPFHKHYALHYKSLTKTLFRTHF